MMMIAYDPDDHEDDHGGHDHGDKDTCYDKSCSKVNSDDHSPGQASFSMLTKLNGNYNDDD